MVVVGFYHLFTRRQVSNKAEESIKVANWYVKGRLRMSRRLRKDLRIYFGNPLNKKYTDELARTAKFPSEYAQA